MTHYNEDDDNFVSKFSKINFSDDMNAMKIRNNSYSRKYIEINLTVHFCPEVDEYRNPEDIFHYEEDSLAATKKCSKKIKVKCQIVNPSIRF